MPILAQEECIYPEDLFDQVDDVDWRSQEHDWWVMYTKSRREKQLCRILKSAGVAFYCPLNEKRSRSPGGRVRTSWLPLFSSYVFMHGDPDSRLRALETNCVAKSIRVDAPGRFAQDLSQIRKLIGTGAKVTVEANLQPGSAVRVTSGPLCGQEGILIRRRGKSRLLVAVNVLGQGASVLLDDFAIEKLY